MEKKPISKKVPILLAVVWLVLSIGSFFLIWPKLRSAVMAGMPFPDISYIYAVAGALFSVAMMAVIRALSNKAGVKWLAILSKILLIYYIISGGICIVAFSILAFVGLI